MTDEQTFRTLGCYRDLMEPEQAFPWGREAYVETPNIDRIANEGAICTRFYASSPVSTPSRASFQTGLYPVATEAPVNDMEMNPNLTTYAQKLKEAGYYTSYVGKWHLSGVPKIDRLYMEPGYNYGYIDRTFMFDDGHWKWYDEVNKPNKIMPYADHPGAQEKYIYSTDYLTDKAIEVIERDKEKPFYLMLSIPDPHSPDVAREPYKSQYLKLNYTEPVTNVNDKEDKRPRWGSGGTFNMKGKGFNKESVANYFGSVKCIDDNIGRVLKALEDNGVLDNTIIVFTSDHGDMLYEHSRINKGMPYDASAKIPFVIRYPKKIKAGKIINKAYTSVDFAPTILGLLNVDQIDDVHGIDDSKLFTNNEMEVNSDRIVYGTVCAPRSEWTMATDGRYKLVLSCWDTPWLFDLANDPDEIINFYSHPDYKNIAEKLQVELVRQMKLYKEPALDYGYPYLYSADDKVTYRPLDFKGKNFVPNTQDPLIKDMINYSIRPLK